MIMEGPRECSMAHLLDIYDGMADFLASQSPSTKDAAGATRMARSMLEAQSHCVPEDGYRALKQAIHNASKAPSALLVQEILRDVYDWKAPEPVRRP